MKSSDGSGNEIGWEENKELERLVWMQETKEKAISKCTLGLEPRKQMIPLVFMENNAGRREASNLSIVLTVSGKSFVFSPRPDQIETRFHKSLGDWPGVRLVVRWVLSSGKYSRKMESGIWVSPEG